MPESKSLKEIVFAPASWSALAVSSLAFLVLLIRTFTKAGDFSVYFAAGLRYLNGVSVHVIEPNVFSYPTFMALLMAPLTWLGHDAAKIIFFLANFAGLIVGVRIVSHYLLAALNPRNAQIVFWLSLLICSRYFLAVFNNQQTDLIVFALVVFAVCTLTGNPKCCPRRFGGWLHW